MFSLLQPAILDARKIFLIREGLMLLPTLYAYMSCTSIARRIISKYYYQWISPILDRSAFSFMNYGYAEHDLLPGSLPLSQDEELHRMPIQMYHHLAASVELDGKDVLEVSCGRGGGAAFVKRYHRPRSLVGIDRTLPAIQYCRKKHRQAGLSFLQGDAEAIDFGSECFDVVMNVEASHLYGRACAFLSEVYRVLRPGGYLLLADKRPQGEAGLLRQQIGESGFEVVCERDISANVQKAIEQQRAYRLQMLHSQMPSVMAWLAIHLVGADGSHLAYGLTTGGTVYLSFILRKG